MDLVIGKTTRFVFMTTVERKRHYGVALAANKTAEAVKNVILEALSPTWPQKLMITVRTSH